ncbi:hypothetical protein [Streptomyces candidus]|uniref:Uncharacterized protein n=1 Tax=Streptomyces candidus TaxID=67283 RepID=A0A7X0LSN0_9ACTN|nr:hypothetical protein [Streptomyces candidus]MBB6439392.1 hypothetical protein [Streptomyces candidus]GHH54921.1 hypothetical protein GCM10018773_58650 [Streptomyces candidus]
MAETTDTEEPASAPAPGGASEKKPDPPQRWVWANMPVGERETRLGELVLWVDWVIETYEVRSQIAKCWYRHPRILEQLTALYVGWARTYAGDPSKVGLRGEVDWIKEFYSFLPRLNSASCQSVHTDPPKVPLTDGEAFTQWADEPAAFLAEPPVHPAHALSHRMAKAAEAEAKARAARTEAGQQKG